MKVLLKDKYCLNLEDIRKPSLQYLTVNLERNIYFIASIILLFLHSIISSIKVNINTCKTGLMAYW